MNSSNLIPNTERSPEELREMGRKGGIASGKARRKNKRLQQMFEIYMDVSGINAAMEENWKSIFGSKDIK